MYKILVVFLQNYLTEIFHRLKDLLMADPKDAQITSLQNEINDLKAKMGKLNTSGGGSLTTSMNSLGSKLDSLSAGISTNNSIMGRVSALSGLTDNSKIAAFAATLTAGAKLFNTFVEQATQSSNAIFEMYRSGVVIRMDQLSATANSFGLTIQELTPLLTKHGQTVSTMGITRTAQLGEMFRAITRNGADFGMTIAQANETVLTYADILNTSGRLRLMSDTEIRDGALKFADQMEAAAQATGKNVEQLAQESKARLEQTDVLWAYAHMTEEQKAQMENLQTTLLQFGKAGDEMFTQAVAYTTQGMAGVSQDMMIALGDRGRALLDTLANAVTPEDQRAAMMEIYGAIKNNLLPEGAMVSPELRGAASIQAEFINAMEKSIAASEGRDTAENRNSEAIDETAAKIGDLAASIESSVKAFDNAINDTMVAAADAFSAELDYLVGKLSELATVVSGGSRSLLDPAVRADLVDSFKDLIPYDLLAAAGAAGLAGVAGLNRPGPPTGLPPGITGSAVEAAATTQGLFSRFASTLKGIFGGVALSTAGDVATATGYDRTGAGLNAGGEILTDTVIGKFLGSLVNRSGVGAAAGLAYGTYQSSDDIARALGIDSLTPGAVTTPPVTAETPSFTDMLYGTTPYTESATLDAQTEALITPLDAIAVTNIKQLDQEKLLAEQNLLILEELKKLNENMDEQTQALKNAYSQGNGNIYPR